MRLDYNEEPYKIAQEVIRFNGPQRNLSHNETTSDQYMHGMIENTTSIYCLSQ